MASVIKARYQFAGTNRYINDRGVASPTLVKNFVVPPGMTQAQAAALVAAVGGELISFGNTVITEISSVCPESQAFKPRRIRLIRDNGNSLSLVVPVRSALVTRAAAAQTAFTAVDADNPCVCVQLEGEEYRNIIDELTAAGKAAPTPGVPSRPAAEVGKGKRYSGLMSGYESDVPFGAAVLAKFSLNTDVVAANGVPGSPTILGNTLAGCLGDVEFETICPPSINRQPRYYTVTLLTTTATANVNDAQDTKVPVAGSADAEILSCGQALATLASAACLGYKGESNSRLHKFFPAAAPAPGG